MSAAWEHVDPAGAGCTLTKTCCWPPGHAGDCLPADAYIERLKARDSLAVRRRREEEATGRNAAHHPELKSPMERDYPTICEWVRHGAVSTEALRLELEKALAFVESSP